MFLSLMCLKLVFLIWVFVILNCLFQRKEGCVISHQSTWWQCHSDWWSIFGNRTLAFETHYFTQLKSRILSVHPNNICITSLLWPLILTLSMLPKRWLSSNLKTGTAGQTLLQPIWRSVNLLDPHLLRALHTNNLGVVTINLIRGHRSSFSESFLQPSR